MKQVPTLARALEVFDRCTGSVSSGNSRRGGPGMGGYYIDAAVRTNERERESANRGQ